MNRIPELGYSLKKAQVSRFEAIMSTQRYVSNELTHFIGRGRTENQQYDLLVNQILKPGCTRSAKPYPGRGQPCSTT
jgi:hypothetical protein